MSKYLGIACKKLGIEGEKLGIGPKYLWIRRKKCVVKLYDGYYTINSHSKDLKR